MANQDKERATKVKTTSSKSSSSGSSNKKKSSSSSKATKKVTKSVEKDVAKFAKKNPAGFIIIGILLIAGIVLGYVGGTILLKPKESYYEMNAYVRDAASSKTVSGETADDLFKDDSDEDYNIGFIVLLLNETYVEAGVSCVYKGEDFSSSYKVTYSYREDISYDAVEVDNVDSSKSGFYYASYETDCQYYSDVKLVRTIKIVEVENDG